MSKIQPTIDQKEYKNFVQELKGKIQSAQVKASLAVNSEMILLYWDIGQKIVDRQENLGWGKSVVNMVSKDLKVEFPDLNGFSPQNLWKMRMMYLVWSQDFINLSRVVIDFKKANLLDLLKSIPWGQNTALIYKVKDATKRFWYAQQIVKNGWSLPILTHQIDSNLFERQARGNELTNFNETLPAVQSDLARELVKDPYDLGFLPVHGNIKEKELQKSLVEKLKDFLVELGVGFAFVGTEYRLEVGGQDFYIDLLFYHLKLRCYVILELKTVPFQPEFAGKMNFYLSAVDDLVAHQDDQPSIGIILCKDKNKTIVEYALRDSRKPMGVSSYKLTETLPKKLKGKFPSIEQLEEELKNK